MALFMIFNQIDNRVIVSTNLLQYKSFGNRILYAIKPLTKKML